MLETITFSSRHCGPPTSANGGYASGSLARFLEGDVEVTLRLPPPLETPLEVVVDEEHASLRDGDALIATAVRTLVTSDVPPAVSFDVAAEAAELSAFYDLGWHPFASCFTCGPLRDADDGLRIFAGPVVSTEFFAAPWQPASVDEATVWAALDCPSAAPLMGRTSTSVFVLGRMAAHIEALPTRNEPHVIMSWSRGAEGRKHHSASALYDSDGRCIARALATWISISS